VCKCKNKPVETVPSMGRKEIKQNGGGGDIFDLLLRTFVNATMYSHSAQ
jgi:hypothetical protein